MLGASAGVVLVTLLVRLGRLTIRAAVHHEPVARLGFAAPPLRRLALCEAGRVLAVVARAEVRLARASLLTGPQSSTHRAWRAPAVRARGHDDLVLRVLSAT